MAAAAVFYTQFSSPPALSVPEMVQAVQAMFPDEKEQGELQLVAPAELLTGEGLHQDTAPLLARLATLFPVHERFTEDLLSEGIPRVVPEPLGYQFSLDNLIDFRTRARTTRSW